MGNLRTVLGSSGDYILTILQFSAWDTLVFLWEIRDIQCNTTNSQRTKMPIFLCMAAVLSRSSSQWELHLHLSGKCWSVSATSVSHWERNVEKLDGQTSRYEIKGWTENLLRSTLSGFKVRSGRRIYIRGGKKCWEKAQWLLNHFHVLRNKAALNKLYIVLWGIIRSVLQNSYRIQPVE